MIHESSSQQLCSLLDQKIQEVARMRAVLAKQLQQVNLISSVKQQMYQSGHSLLLFLSDLKCMLRELKAIPDAFKSINEQWGKIIFEEKILQIKEVDYLKSKYSTDVRQLQTELRKQYQITHTMKDQVEGLKRLIDQYMNENQNSQKQKIIQHQNHHCSDEDKNTNEKQECYQKKHDTSPIRSMSEDRPPILQVIVEQQQITSTKRGDEQGEDTLQNILGRARTQQKIIHKEYITLGNLHQMIRTNSAQRPLSEKKLDLNSADIYYKTTSKFNCGNGTDDSRSQITVSEGVYLNDLELENLSKMISKNMEKKLFSNRRISAETKNATSKDLISFLELEDLKLRGLHSFRDRRVNKENEDYSREKSRQKEKDTRQLSKEEKYKAMIKNILTKKEKQTKKKKQFVLNIGTEQKMQVDYQGHKKDGKKHGKGLVYYKNGLSYQGQFKNGQRSGYGILRFNHIQIYNGEWQSDAIYGEGRVKNCTIFASKKKDLPVILQKWISYSGGFKNNRFQGSGTLFMPGGEKYLGMFRNGYPCNEGTLYKSNGEVEFGQWKGDNFVKKC